MPFDLHQNLAISSVAVAPVPAVSGTTLQVQAGHGARFPAPPFNVTIWLSTAMPSPVDAEVARVTAIAGDILTLLRAQEGTTARTVLVGDLIAETITAKALTDIEEAIGSLQVTVATGPVALHAANHEVGGSDPIDGDLSLGNIVLSNQIVSTRYAFHAGSEIRAMGDGIIKLANAGQTDFSLLQFGGTTAAFPALKRSGTDLHVKTANDAGFGDIYVKNVVANSGTLYLSPSLQPQIIAGPSGPPEGNLAAGVGSLYLRSDIEAGVGTTLYMKQTGGTGTTGWVPVANVGAAPSLHAPTHAAGGTDPVTVTGLAGFPGGTTNFLRADGTFAAPAGGGGGTPALHAVTHTPGNTDTIPNVAWTNVANTFVPTQTFSGHLVFGGVFGTIRTDTVDGADNKTLLLTGGGAASITRGAVLTLNGNETNAGSIELQAGNVAGGAIRFGTSGLHCGTIHPSGGFSWGGITDPGATNLSLSGALVLTATDNSIRTDTVDGLDSKSVALVASGASSPTRGAAITVFGNEAGAPGAIYVSAGDASQGNINFLTGTTTRGVMHRSGGFSWGSITDPGAYNFSVPSGQLFLGTPNQIYYPAALNCKFTAATGPGVAIQSAVDSATASFVLFHNAAAGIQGSISSPNPSTTAYNTTSDARLKTPLNRHTDTEVLRNTVIHNFVWKSDGHPGRGVFAQEAQLVAPFAVSVGSDEVDDEGRLTHPWGVDYSKYVPDLIVGWQQQQAELAALRAELTALRAALGEA